MISHTALKEVSAGSRKVILEICTRMLYVVKKTVLCPVHREGMCKWIVLQKGSFLLCSKTTEQEILAGLCQCLQGFQRSGSWHFSDITSSYQPACLNPRMNPRIRASGALDICFFFPASTRLWLGNPELESPLVLIDLHPRSLWLRPCIPNSHSVVLRVIYPPKPKRALCASVRWCTHNREIQFFIQMLKFHEGCSSVKSHIALIILNEMPVAKKRSKEVI